jgi:hypothetical protein
MPRRRSLDDGAIVKAIRRFGAAHRRYLETETQCYPAPVKSSERDLHAARFSALPPHIWKVITIKRDGAAWHLRVKR